MCQTRHLRFLPVSFMLTSEIIIVKVAGQRFSRHNGQVLQVPTVLTVVTNHLRQELLLL